MPGAWWALQVRPASGRRDFSSACPSATTPTESRGTRTISLAQLFGSQTGDSIDKFSRCAWHAGPQDMPILDDAIAWFVGKTLTRIDVGDHVGHLLEPIAGEAPDSVDELIIFADVTDLEPGHEA